jgi:hypothetical protein
MTSQIDQYNFYLNFKKEINNMKYEDLLFLLSKYEIHFDEIIYNMFIETINKSELKEYEKKFMNKFVYLQV